MQIFKDADSIGEVMMRDSSIFRYWKYHIQIIFFLKAKDQRQVLDTLRLCIILLLAVCLLNSCAASKKETQIISQPEKIQKNRDAIREIHSDYLKFLATSLYDYKKKPVIKVSLDKIAGSYSKEPMLSKYLKSEISKELKHANQLTLVSDNVDFDCKISIHLEEGEDNKINVSTNIYKPDKNTIIHSNSFEFLLDDFNIENLAMFKKREIRKQLVEAKYGKTYITITGQNYSSNTGLKEKDKTYNFYAGTVYKDTVIVGKFRGKYSPGYSGFYPAKQKCTINSKQYKLNSDHIFYQGRFLPGELEIETKFLGGYYNASIGTEQFGEKYSRKFIVKLKKNDNLQIDFYYYYDGKSGCIDVEAYKIYNVKKAGKIEKIRKPIKISSN